MKFKFIFNKLRKLTAFPLLALSVFAFGQNNGPALEMAAGSGNPTGNGPTTGAQTIFFQNNTDNATTGTTFVPYAPTLTATYTIANVRANQIVNFGQTTTGPVPIFDLMNVQGAPADASFTSAGASTGAGIVGSANRAVRLYVQTLPLRTAGVVTSSTNQIADLVITFSRPVNNPVIHIGGLGGNSAATPSLGYAAILDLTASTGTGVSLTRLSGNNTTGFQSTGTSISNGSTTFTATGTNSGSGSVRVNGTGITSLTFRISLKGDGANTATTAWAPNNDASSGEAFTVGFSTLESDIRLTKTMANATAAVGATTNFVVTATNNGPSNNGNINITDVLPSGYAYNGTPTATVGTYSTATGIWNIPTLNSAASATLTIPVTVQATGNYINIATVTSATAGDSNPGNNRAVAARTPDTDGDGIFDLEDLDNDNDGITNALEDNCVKPNRIPNGDFANGATNWQSGFYPGPNNTGPLTFNSTLQSLDIFVDNEGSLYPGNIILVNTAAVNFRTGVYYNFTSTLNIITGANNVNFSWVLIDASNNIVQTIQSYKTLASGNGDVQITATPTAYPVGFFSTGTGLYRLALTWTTNSTIAGNAQDVRIDNISLITPCDTDGDGNPNYLDLDSDNDGCFDAIEGDESVLPSQLNANGSINTTANGGIGTTAGTNNGVPNLVNTGGAADNGGDIGQGIGDSQSLLANTQCIDTDGDGYPDNLDLDDDNDGIADTLEESCALEGVPVYFNNFGTGATTGTDANVLGHTYLAQNPQDGQYTVTTSLAQTATYAQTDTTGNLDAGNPVITSGSTDGRYLMINIASAATLNQPIYRVSNLPTTVGLPYRFRIDMAGLAVGAGDIPNLQLSLRDAGGNLLASANSGALGIANDDVWRRLSLNFVATTTSVTLEIVNLQGSTAGGNDIGIDNIVLTPYFVCDTDGDGIPNSQDLDSDGDGCTDAIEGGAPFTNANLVTAVGTLATQTPNQNLGNTVGNTATTRGIPTIAATGQSVAQSQDAERNDCLDTDADGIPNWQDLDDDNDGILDTAEDTCNTEGTPVYSNTFGTGAREADPNVLAHTFMATGTIGDGTYAVTTSALAGPATYNQTDLTGNLDAGNPVITNGSTAGRYLAINVDSPGTINQPIYRVSNLPTIVGTRYRFRIDMAGLLNGGGAIPSLGLTIKDTNGNVLAKTNSASIGIANDDVWRRLALNFTATTTTVVLEIVNLQVDGNGNDLGFDNVVLAPILICDADGDGIPNSQDLDSDGDGCTDAIEGGANFTNANLVAATGSISTQTPNQNLGNTVGNTTTTLGVPTIAGTGQSVGQSQNAVINDCIDSDGDGIPNWQDLDNDNDGILDTVECPPTNVFANYTAATISNSTPTSTVSNITFGSVTGTLSRVFNGTTGGAIAVITSNFSNAAIYTPAGSATQPTLSEFNSGYKGTSNFTRYTLTLSAPVESITLQIDGFDYMKTRFVGNHAEQLLSGGTEFVYDPATRTLYDSNPLTTSVVTRDGYGSLRITSRDGLPFTQIVYEKFDDPNSTSGNLNTSDGFNYTFSVVPACDTDGDGIPNRLDLDSDNDGCPDAIEGGAAITNAQLVNAGGTLRGGNGTNPVVTPASGSYNQSVLLNLCATGACVNTNGVPQLSPLPAGYSNATGQSVGDSQNALINLCYCYKQPVLNAGTTVPVQHGITALNRAGSTAGQWPVVRQSAWTVLEANSKGFVVNKVPFEDADNNANTPTTPVGIPTANYVEGMMVYDTIANCLKIYNGTFWNCYSTQTCPQ